MPSSEEFLPRLARYLECLPRTHRYSVEVRNRKWLGEPLLELLRSSSVALALVDQVWMPPITDKIIVDRERETKTWVDYIRQFIYHGRTVYAYYNNHRAGFAPGSTSLLAKLWEESR